MYTLLHVASKKIYSFILLPVASKKYISQCNFFNLKLFQAFRAVPKIGSIFTTCTLHVPIFGNVDGSWRVTSKLRGSTLIQVARRRSKVFQRFSASLVQVGVPNMH